MADLLGMSTRVQIANQLFPHRWMLLSIAVVPLISVAGSLFLTSDIIAMDRVLGIMRLPLTASIAATIAFAWTMLFTPADERRSDDIPRAVLIRLAVLTAMVAAGIAFVLSQYARAIAA